MTVFYDRLPKSKPFQTYLLNKGTWERGKVPSLLCIALCASGHISSAFGDALDLNNCHTLLPYVKMFVISLTFLTQKSTNKMPKQNILLICQVISNLSTMGFQDRKAIL